MNLVWRSTIKGHTKRFLLLAIADRADDYGYCWPGMQNLTEKTGMGRSTIKRLRKELEMDNLLVQEQRRKQSGENDTNGYWINLDELGRLQRPRRSARETSTVVGDRAAQSGPAAAQSGPRGGSGADPNTSVESSVSHQEKIKPASQAYPKQASGARNRPGYVEGQDDPEEWIMQDIDSYGPGEEAAAMDMLGRGMHPKHTANVIHKLRR